MKKKWLKISIIAITILIVIIVIVIMNQRKKDIGYQDSKQDKDESILYEEKENASKVTSETMFYTVEDCVKKYLEISSYHLNQSETEKRYKNSRVEFQNEEEKNKAIYDVLDKDYIEKNNITMNNVKEYTYYSSNDLYFTAKAMNFIQRGMMEKYSVYGKIRVEQDYKNSKEAYFIVTLDKTNLTFSIEPISEKDNMNIDQITLGEPVSSIEKNTYNVFTYERVTESDVSTRYMAHYKGIALYNPEEAYEYLDKTYREKRFGSVENYIQYVNNNRNDISKIFIDKYKKSKENGYTQYVCIDTNGNYYIFRENAIMQYSLLLDTYTIDIPEFTTKYNAGNEQQKVGMNIEKIVAALNNKDYSYVYGKLADGFKNNYFTTQEQFEYYAKQDFFELNVVEYTDFKHEGQNYMYTVEIKNKEQASQSTTKTVIMQLKSGNDFVFSFNI